MPLDSQLIRQQFPLYADQPDLVYLDNAATTQKPLVVLEAMDTFYKKNNANVHRGMHQMTEHASIAYENARTATQQFLHAQKSSEIIFTKSCTESINLIAKTWGRAHLTKGDAVVLSILEHHSNIVPWLQLKEEIGIDVEWMEIDEEGNLRLEMLEDFLEKGNVKLVSITGQSNVLGVRPDLQKIIQKAHATEAKVLVDAAQLVGHHRVNVQELDCDFLAFSGHKLYGPFGIGVLYAKKELLQEMPPFLGGGMMIHEVHTHGFSAADAPEKFEAGTPPVAEAIGLHAAIDWLSQLDWNDIENYERELIENAYSTLSSLDGITILGPKKTSDISGCLSFVFDTIHAHDFTDILGTNHIALRAGHHCCQPLHEYLEVTASSRVSVGLYNTIEDMQKFYEAALVAIKKLS